jgi:hypothetical protein
LRRRPLLRELLDWIVLRRPAESVADVDRAVKKKLEAVAHTRNQVACGLHIMSRYDVSPRRAAVHASSPGVRVTSRDLEAVQRLAKRAGVSLRELDQHVELDVHAHVDSYLERLEVVLERRALEDLLLSALEGYAVPRPGRGQKYTEVFGYCFGSRRDIRFFRLTGGSDRGIDRRSGRGRRCGSSGSCGSRTLAS